MNGPAITASIQHRLSAVAGSFIALAKKDSEGGSIDSTLREICGFNQKRRYLKAKIKFFKKILTYFPTSSYENHKLPIVAFFRIKSAGSSNYRACPELSRRRRCFLASGQKPANNQYRRSAVFWQNQLTNSLITN